MKRRLIPFAAGLAALMLATPSLAKTNLRLWTFDSGTKLMPRYKGTRK